MPSFLSRLIGAAAPSRAPDIQTKASRTGPLLALQTLGLARWMPRSNTELTRAGYERNAVVYRCVRMIAEAAATVPWLVYEDEVEDEHHPILKLLARPNPAGSQGEFLEQIFTNLLLAGNAYVEAVSVDAVLRELYALRPDRIRIEPGQNGWPAAYEYAVGAQKVRFAVEPDGLSPILHLKMCNPLGDHYGYAPLSAAQEALDIHNAASGWNRALLENAVRPSGALVYSGGDGAGLTHEQFDRPKAELDENFPVHRMSAGRCCWKAGSTGRRCRCRRMIWTSSRPRLPPRAKSPSPLACRRCCSACRVTIRSQTMLKPTGLSGGRRLFRWCAVRSRVLADG